MANFTNIFRIIESNVSASSLDIDLSAIIPNGQTVTLKVFGGAIPFQVSGSYIAIQWGDNSGGWNTIRAITREAEYLINREFIGNGVRRFRIVRNNTDIQARAMVAWIEGFIHDA